MHLFLTALWITIWFSGYETSNVVYPFHNYSYRDTIRWKDYEQPVSQGFRDSAISYLTENVYNFVGDLPEDKQEAYPGSFHFMELSGDNQIDVIFEGWSGLEHKSTEIFLNTGNRSFLRIFDGRQVVTRLEIQNSRLKSITLVDMGNDFEFLEQEVRYDFDSTLHSHICYVRARLNDTFHPDSIWQIPIHFRTTTPRYTLRFSPEVNNEPRILIFEEVPGNAVALFPKGSKGWAWAEYRDNKGDIWWYVEMEPNEKITQSIVYSRSSKLRCIGWMKAQYLQRISK